MKRLFFLLATLTASGSVACAQTVDSIVTIPMTCDRYLYIYPTLRDSISGRFFFDMGAQLTMVDSGFLARHGARLTQTQNAVMVGYGNQKRTAIYSTDTLRFDLNGHPFASSPNVVYPFEPPLNVVDGLFGPGLFGGRIFAIDYAAGTLRVLPPSALDTLGEDRYQHIPFTVNHKNFIILPLTLVIDSAAQRSISGHVHIDTGDPGSLTLDATRKQMRRWERHIRQQVVFRVPCLGISGGGELRNIRAQALKIGDHTLPVHEIPLHTQSTSQDKATIGAIGNQLLSQFGTVIFDMAGQTLYLPRGEQFKNQDPVNYSGFRLSAVDRWFVNGRSHHPVAVRDGDTVTHIDSHPIDSLSRTQRKAYFCTPDKQYTLTVIRNGERLDIPVTNLNDKTLWH